MKKQTKVFIYLSPTGNPETDESLREYLVKYSVIYGSKRKIDCGYLYTFIQK